MPTIGVFYGILIRMFFNDHAPPHFHDRYGEFEATVDIATLAVLEGTLIQEWGMMHKEERLSKRHRCRENAALARIEPLP